MKKREKRKKRRRKGEKAGLLALKSTLARFDKSDFGNDKIEPDFNNLRLEGIFKFSV